jgi:phage terminase large subunit-like protein
MVVPELCAQPHADLQEGLGADLERFKRWKPDAQAKVMARIREAEQTQWAPFYCTNRNCNGQPHVWPDDTRPCPNPFGHQWVLLGTVWKCVDHKTGDLTDKNGRPTYCGVTGTPLDSWLWNHARADQWPPRWKDDWLTLFMRGGRGSGKTKTGAEITNRVTKLVPRITLIAATGPDFRTFMVEGESGILASSAPGERPIYEPSKKQLTWPNGCIALGYSAEEPDRLRGQNSGFVWSDEPAHYPLVEACWDNMLFGLRKGDYPKIVATSTPKPTKWVKSQINDPTTIDRVVSSYANLPNLSPVYRDIIIPRYEGSRTGAQELHGEVLEDVEGSLWKWEMIEYVEGVTLDDMKRMEVGIDPAGTKNKRSDETGIIVAGLGYDDNYYVFGDYTDRYSPEGWGKMANRQYSEWQADALVPERNYGEDMVIFVLQNTVGKRNKDLMPRIKAVRSRRGKAIRAEPVVALYEKNHKPGEKGKVFHVGARGALQALDDELTTWVPGEGDSPNRVDALVHVITSLGKGSMPAEVGSPARLSGGGPASPGGRGGRALIPRPR